MMSNQQPVIDLAQLLIKEESITPDNSNCHQLIGERLTNLGFKVEQLSFNGVNNLWAYLPGKTDELFVFCGHTDVVPPGDKSAWSHDPFAARIEADNLYGRGAVDMKSSIAAMITALTDLLTKTTPQGPQPHKSIGVLITADEEGEAVHGVKRALEALHDRGVRINYCLVGEPTSEQQCGDTLKNGRRGSIRLTASFEGVEGHAAYIPSHDNVLHRLTSMAQRLIDEDWDHLASTPPTTATTFNLTSIEGSSAADNMTAPKAVMKAVWRSLIPANLIKQQATALLEDCQLRWQMGAEPYLSPSGMLQRTLAGAIQQVCNIRPQTSTAGGTSDGRFFAPYGVEIIEFGPCNKTMHCANEHIPLQELQQLTDIYKQFCRDFLLTG